MGLITNASREMTSAALEHFKIKEYFEEIFTGGDPDCVKPATCPIDKARDYLDAYRQSSLIVGDMAVDSKAGKKAGIKTCGVTYGIGSEKELKEESADFIIDDLADLKDIVKL
jgi:phosphoglycolate phosphatase-like HAD superfamily hydrolase